MGSVPAGYYITPMQGLAAKLQDPEVLKGAAAASGSRGRILPLLSYSFKLFFFFHYDASRLGTCPGQAQRQGPAGSLEVGRPGVSP